MTVGGMIGRVAAVAIIAVALQATRGFAETVETTPMVAGFADCTIFAPRGDLALGRMSVAEPSRSIGRAWNRNPPSRGASSTGRLALLEPLIEKYGDEFDVDPALVRAIIRAESSWNRRATSPKGARGLMQLMPATARDYGVVDLHSAEENIRGGVEHLRFLLDRYRDDVKLALAAYNAGAKPVDRHRGIPPITETREYVARVLRYHREYRAATR
ncbi:MAG: lytic transglycosylase domain-containing protein [Candidatus Binatia bacterium]